jgi:hypothetical protein
LSHPLSWVGLLSGLNDKSHYTTAGGRAGGQGAGFGGVISGVNIIDIRTLL